MTDSKWSYLVQAMGFVLAVIGVLRIIDDRPAVALLLFAGLAWWIGGYARNKGIL
jgi:hypothetical protein